MKDRIDVLIVGAGPTGLVAALDLARRKIPFRIIDRAPHPVKESRAIAIWARTLEMLDRLDVTDTFLENGNRILGMDAFFHSEPLFQASLEEIDSPYPFVLALPQNETEEILSDRLKKAGVTVERSVELLQLTQDGETVRATVSRGAKGRELIQARWVLGCDGAHSAVRKQLGLEFPGGAYDSAFALADVDVEWRQPSSRTTVFLTTDGLVAFFPFGRQRYRIVAELPPVVSGSGPHGVPEEMGLGEFEELLKGRIPEGVRFSNPRWVARFHIHHRRASHFRSSRVFVVGDAAHIHSPVGGQGMNTSIQDALNLTWKLAHVIQGAASPDLLDTYQSERLPVSEGLLRATDMATRLLTVRPQWLQRLRNRLLKGVLGSELVRQRLVSIASELKIHYAPSALVGGKRASRGTLRAGHRAPDGELRIGTARSTLFARLKKCEHSILLFSGPPDRSGAQPFSHLAAELVRRFGSWAEVITISSGNALEKMPGLTCGVDAEGELHRKYGVKQPAVFWIRPDGYVGFRGEPVGIDALEAFLSTSFDLKKMPRRTSATTRTRAASSSKSSRPRTRAAK